MAIGDDILESEFGGYDPGWLSDLGMSMYNDPNYYYQYVDPQYQDYYYDPMENLGEQNFQQPWISTPTPEGENSGVLDLVKSGIGAIASADPRLLATLGLGGVFALMGLTSDGGGNIKLPDGRQVQLSPQEQEFMNTILNQAKQTAAISTPANEALAAAAQRNVGNIGETMDVGLKTLADQQKNQAKVTDAVGQTLNDPRLAEILGSDLDIAQLSNENLQSILQQSGAGDESDVAEFWRGRVLGDGSGVSPELLLEQEDARNAAKAAALRTGGPGYETSTWFNNQFNRLGREQEIARDFSRTDRAALATDAFNKTRITDQSVLDSLFGRSNTGVGTGAKTVAALQTIGQHGSATPAGLMSLLTDKDPTASASAGFTGLAGLGNFQANQGLAAQMFNSQTNTQNRNMLLGAGGTLLGRGLSRV